MAGASYSLKPKAVPKVNTRYRRIVTKIPVPESVPILKKLRRYEPLSMTGQPPIVWDRAEGLCVYDRWGNRWLDWSSGVLVANAGHANPAIARAMKKQIDKKLLHNYCFPSEIRAALAERLIRLAPKGMDKAFILTTGAETTECAIKLARTHGRRVGGDRKIGIVTFCNAFHGRTMGSQMAGGSPALKEWIVNIDPTFYNIEFPGDLRASDTSFAAFLRQLKALKIGAKDIAAVMSETYQGGGASFMPKAYAQALRQWCTENDVVLIFDEVQAGFGRCGKLFGFQHYGVVPDLACFGKGITSCMPLSAVLGRKDLMDQYAPGSMTSTHTGNPVCSAAALASLDYIVKHKLPQNAARMGAVLQDGLDRIRQRFPDHIAAVHGKGLVAGMHMVQPGGTEPDGYLAFRIVQRCMQKGLLMFSPVGFGGATVKIAPPLIVTKTALLEGIAVLEEAVEEEIARP